MQHGLDFQCRGEDSGFHAFGFYFYFLYRSENMIEKTNVNEDRMLRNMRKNKTRNRRENSKQWEKRNSTSILVGLIHDRNKKSIFLLFRWYVLIIKLDIQNN